MRSLCITIITICLSASVARAQSPHKQTDAEPIFLKVEHEAYTDLSYWRKYLQQYGFPPDSVLEKIPLGEYAVTAVFIVDRYGYVSEVKIEKDPGYGLGPHVKKIIQQYSGKWQPAMQSGFAVKSYKKQPVIYRIIEEECEK